MSKENGFCGARVAELGTLPYSVYQDRRCGSSDIDELIIVLIGRMMILYNSERTIFKITALSAPYSVSLELSESFH
jgi:hypothetical protein